MACDVTWLRQPPVEMLIASNQLEKLQAARDASFGYLQLHFITFGYLSLPFLTFLYLFLIFLLTFPCLSFLAFPCLSILFLTFHYLSVPFLSLTGPYWALFWICTLTNWVTDWRTDITTEGIRQKKKCFTFGSDPTNKSVENFLIIFFLMT